DLYQANQTPVAAIRSDLFHNSGASAALELGLTLSAVAEITVGLIDAGLTADQALHCITLFQPVGSLYFVEIAKLRATRRLSALLAKGFGVLSYQNPILNQSIITSLFNQSYYDQHTNMLRGCTEVMSAVLGGATSIIALPLDAAFQKDDTFSRRMAINTQLIVRNESYLHKVADPAGGSYYIEDATDKIAESAWRIFQEIEAEGGYLAGLEKGTIQGRLKQAGQKRLEDLANRKEIQIGVNQFPNNNEQLLKENKTAATMTQPTVSNRFETVTTFRFANSFEQLRLTTESCSRRPNIQLLPFGQLSMQRARAAFIVNFFGCAGFSVNDPGSLETIDQCLEFAKNMSNIDAFVLCASDSEYLPAVTKFKDQLQELKVPIIVAGNPTDSQELTSLGIDNFIHIKTNLLQTLTDYQQRFCK
ncbi:MAG: methylmalonyl-CoA mutase, partial [Leptonema sp. (in: Bacteria)]|nr:methylmalonyl-CoA mutase [Leptonema sp. (in: bacteria)]